MPRQLAQLPWFVTNPTMRQPVSPSPAKFKRAMAMPRTARCDQLLAVARKIIAEGGIGALTMAALAQRAGVSKPVVYEHFDNSESVAVALLDEHFKAAVEVVDAAARDAATLGDYLSAAVDAQFAFHTRDTLCVWGITNGYSSSERLNKAYGRLQKITLQTFQDPRPAGCGKASRGSRRLRAGANDDKHGL